MKNTHIIVHCSWTIFNSNLPEMELKIFILNLQEIRIERQRMWKENLQVFKNLYVLYTSHEKTLTANYIWFNFILGWCWHVMLRGRSGSAKEYRNIVLLTKFLGEMKVIFSHHCCCDIFDSLITSITFPYLKNVYILISVISFLKWTLHFLSLIQPV